jgi:hypothetical protein
MSPVSSDILFSPDHSISSGRRSCDSGVAFGSDDLGIVLIPSTACEKSP